VKQVCKKTLICIFFTNHSHLRPHPNTLLLKMSDSQQHLTIFQEMDFFSGFLQTHNTLRDREHTPTVTLLRIFIACVKKRFGVDLVNYISWFVYRCVFIKDFLHIDLHSRKGMDDSDSKPVRVNLIGLLDSDKLDSVVCALLWSYLYFTVCHSIIKSSRPQYWISKNSRQDRFERYFHIQEILLLYSFSVNRRVCIRNFCEFPDVVFFHGDRNSPIFYDLNKCFYYSGFLYQPTNLLLNPSFCDLPPLIDDLDSFGNVVFIGKITDVD